LLVSPRPPCTPILPYTTLFRSSGWACGLRDKPLPIEVAFGCRRNTRASHKFAHGYWPATAPSERDSRCIQRIGFAVVLVGPCDRSEEHTSELQSRGHLVCRLLL